MNELILCPSLMCCDFNNYKEEIKALEVANIDIFHCDFIDGCYVKNYSLGIEDIKVLKKNTQKPIDIHLMIENPLSKLKIFTALNPNIIYIHPDSERFCIKTLSLIKESNIKAGIAINPDMSIYSISEFLPLCDYVLFMTVSPGFAGQKFIESTLKKLKDLIELRKTYNYKIIIDGACSYEVIKRLHKMGADGFVLGTSALFNKNNSYKEIIDEIRRNESH